MRQKVFWLFSGIVVTLLLGFNANPSPQPQRVSDLVARLDALEEENSAQQDQLDALSERLDTLEASAGEAGAPVLSRDVSIPDEWEEFDSSDGIIRYQADPEWELTSDEPGTMDHWLDENTALFFTWDWAFDLLDDLHDDKEFLRIFEEDLIWSDETIRMHLEESGPIEFMGEDAMYWDVRVENADGFNSHMLTIFYPCSERASCNVTLVRFDPDPEDDEEVEEFTKVDYTFLHTFANGIEFLSIDKTTIAANANMRACPDINCDIVGRLVRGEIVEVVAVSADGAWFQLESGEWVSSALVDGAPRDLPVVGEKEDI